MKKAIFIVIPIVLIGAVVGLAMAGIINIPGLTPKKTKPPVLYGENETKVKKAETPPITKKEAPKETKPAVVADAKSDAEKGAKKLAQLWNNIPPAKLVEFTKEYQDKDLAPVLMVMDPEIVAQVLGLLDAKRSAKLSKELQRIASIVPKDAG